MVERLVKDQVVASSNLALKHQIRKDHQKPFEEKNEVNSKPSIRGCLSEALKVREAPLEPNGLFGLEERWRRERVLNKKGWENGDPINFRETQS